MKFKPDNVSPHWHPTTPDTIACTIRFQFRRDDRVLYVVFRVKFPCTKTYPVPRLKIKFLAIVSPLAPLTVSQASISKNMALNHKVVMRQLSRTGEVHELHRR